MLSKQHARAQGSQQHPRSHRLTRFSLAPRHVLPHNRCSSCDRRQKPSFANHPTYTSTANAPPNRDHGFSVYAISV